MKNPHLLRFEHDGFEVELPWRDCGAVWTPVDPQIYGFEAFQNMASKVITMRRFVPGTGTLSISGVITDGVGFRVPSDAVYSLTGMDGQTLAEATVLQLHTEKFPVIPKDETRYAFNVELAIPNSIADKMDREQLEALADRMLATLEQGRQENEFGIDMNWLAVIDIEPLGD